MKGLYFDVNHKSNTNSKSNCLKNKGRIPIGLIGRTPVGCFSLRSNQQVHFGRQLLYRLPILRAPKKRAV